MADVGRVLFGFDASPSSWPPTRSPRSPISNWPNRVHLGIYRSHISSNLGPSPSRMVRSE